MTLSVIDWIGIFDCLFVQKRTTVLLWKEVDSVQPPVSLSAGFFLQYTVFLFTCSTVAMHTAWLYLHCVCLCVFNASLHGAVRLGTADTEDSPPAGHSLVALSRPLFHSVLSLSPRSLSSVPLFSSTYTSCRSNFFQFIIFSLFFSHFYPEHSPPFSSLFFCVRGDLSLQVPCHTVFLAVSCLGGTWPQSKCDLFSDVCGTEAALPGLCPLWPCQVHSPLTLIPFPHHPEPITYLSANTVANISEDSERN